MSPVLGSSSNIHPKVAPGRAEKRQPEAKLKQRYERKYWFGPNSHDTKIPDGQSDNCSTTPILTLLKSERQIPGSAKRLSPGLQTVGFGSAMVDALKLLMTNQGEG